MNALRPSLPKRMRQRVPSACLKPSGGCVGACNLQVATCDNGNGACVDDGTGTGVCVKSCKMGGTDCRDGYECRNTGTFGAEPLPAFNNGTGTPAKFCAPKPLPF